MAAALLAAALAMGSSLTSPQAGRLSPDLEALHLVAGGGGTAEVIISYRQPPAAADRKRLQGRGASGVRELRAARGLAARVPVAALRDIADDPSVESISVDEKVHASTDVSVPSIGAMVVRQALRAEGAGVRIAVVDSGVEPVPGLGASADRPLGRIASWVDLVEPNRAAPGDPFGHGTHVAGIIAGGVEEVRVAGERPVVYGGVAPGAEIVSVRVLDRFGEGRTSDLIAGIDWVVEHAPALRIRILNLSLGHPVREPAATDPLVRACERAWEAGLLVVVSAGNLGREGDGYGTITSPGNSPRVLTVGAANDRQTSNRSDDIPTTYSSRGPTAFDAIVKPDLLAPGNDITSLRSPHSTLDRSFPENRVGSGSRGAPAPEFFRLSGSSMAAAMVSGAAALLVGGDASLDPDTLKARLMRSSEKRDEGLYTRGAGSLDVEAAMEETARARLAASPAVLRGEAQVVVGDLAAWGAGWSADEVYGAASLWREDLAWDFLAPANETEAQTTPVLWQVPLPQDRGPGFVWERVGAPGAQSVVWQIRPGPDSGGVTSESVVWQIRPAPDSGGVTSESVVWQIRPSPGGDTVTADSVVWQIRPSSSGDTVTAESVVWQVDGTGMEILVLGDRVAGP